MSAITLADVDDYINPSQACINPLFTSGKDRSNKNGKGGIKATSTSLEVEADGSQLSSVVKPKKVVRRRRRTPLNLNQAQPPQPLDNGSLQELQKGQTSSKRPTISYAMDDFGTSTETTNTSTSQIKAKKTEKATVSVADCLACSGCITSAEAVFVTTQHSIKTLVEKCTPPQSGERRIVFTISPAAIADLTRVLTAPQFDEQGEDACGKPKLRTDLVYRKLAAFLQQKFNAEVILDGTIPQRIALYESALEFCHRYQFVHGDQQGRLSDGINSLEQKILDARIDIATPTIALSATETRFLLRSKESDELEAIEVKHDAGIDSRLKFMHSSTASSKLRSDVKPSHVLPMLASSCPGFVCYVEKTVKDAIPNLCSVKSPMAIAGSIFKHGLMRRLKDPSKTYGVRDNIIENNESGKDIYHVSIMPCHDKKLEAERKDLAWETFNEQHESLVPDVDLVVTTNEILTFMTDTAMEKEAASSGDVDDNIVRLKKVQEYFQGLPSVESIKSDFEGVLVTNGEYSLDQTLTGGVSTMKGSGSYADFIFRFASSALFGHNIPLTEKLPWKKSGDNVHRRSRSRVSQSGSNPLGDSNEVCLYRHVNGTYSFERKDSTNDEAVLFFSTAYGFKNIQLIMQRVSTGDMKMHGYHYVEVMACPSGCANGGGQTHAASGNRRERSSDMRDRVNKTRQFIDDIVPWLKASELSEIGISEPKDLLHTRFHVVPKLELSTGATAGVAVENTQW